MNSILDQASLYQCSPHVFLRQCGGWMAITPQRWPLSIGVCADTEEEARVAFADAMERWERIPYAPDSDTKGG